MDESKVWLLTICLILSFLWSILVDHALILCNITKPLPALSLPEILSVPIAFSSNVSDWLLLENILKESPINVLLSPSPSPSSSPILTYSVP